MKYQVLSAAIMAALSGQLNAANSLPSEVRELKQQTQMLQKKLDLLQKKLAAQEANQKHPTTRPRKRGKIAKSDRHASIKSHKGREKPSRSYRTSPVQVHTIINKDPLIHFYPSALLADGHVITYIAGTPVITSPYLGDRPAFDGSDYIVNISSINRDIRLMQQRRRLYDAYRQIGYPVPDVPIVAISGKAEPIGEIGRTYFGHHRGDLTLGSSELDVAAALNAKVEAFMSIAYDESPPIVGGPRVANSNFSLNLGFINIGDLDASPFYFTAGQVYVPFGRFSSSMISSPLTLRLARTKARPVILGYKSQYEGGPFAAVYGFKSDTTGGQSGVFGVNWGYIFKTDDYSNEIGVSYISSIDNSAGMQFTGSQPYTTFGGFGSLTNGTEAVHKVPAAGVHCNLSYDRYTFTAEWVGASKRFSPQDLSFNGRGAKPQAAQLEAGLTFMAFTKPASFALGYQWSRQTLALNLPQHRISGVFNISIWKDTVESIEYRHDIDYRSTQYANGAAPPNTINLNTIGTGHSADALIGQIGVYF